MELERLSANATADQVVDILRTDGAVIVENLVSDELIDQANRELAPYIEATGMGPDDFTGRQTARTGALIERSPACRELTMNPLVLATAQELVGNKIQIHLTQTIAIGPGQGAQPVHRDQWAFDFFPFPDDFHVQCNTIWALTDFTEANGATRVMPGSQELPNDFGHSIDETVCAEMSKGSVLLYTGKVYHSGGANQTDEVRIAGNITYCASWVRQEENQYLSCSREVAATLPEDLLRLMGYSRGAYALGYVDDLRDPIEVVRPDLGTRGLGDVTAQVRATPTHSATS